ncbi:MAG: CoA-binding protein [Lentisphaeria bacterium]|nr:CoA-binding protein [Candidatus Neomarinimicrobiota bacterium]MCF7841500.1 CoA-binding protein [Lentisphaeria bacterium]
MHDLINLLKNAKTIVVVGASPNPDRPSHYISKYLMNQGYTVIPVNPGHDKLFGQTCYPRVRDIPESHTIDIVDIFRRSDQVIPIVEDAIERGAGFIWMQDGVINPEAKKQAEAAGIPVEMNNCIYRVHMRSGL